MDLDLCRVCLHTTQDKSRVDIFETLLGDGKRHVQISDWIQTLGNVEL